MKTMNIEIEDFNETGFPFQKLLAILFILLTILYASYHLYNGNYSIKSYINKQNIINQKNIDSKKIEKEIAEIKNKIERLQDNNLDSDLLDEEIRKNTGYAKKNEIIVYSNDLD